MKWKTEYMRDKIEKYCRENYGAKCITGDITILKTDQREVFLVEMVLSEPKTHTAYKYVPADEIK